MRDGDGKEEKSRRRKKWEVEKVKSQRGNGEGQHEMRWKAESLKDKPKLPSPLQYFPLQLSIHHHHYSTLHYYYHLLVLSPPSFSSPPFPFPPSYSHYITSQSPINSPQLTHLILHHPQSGAHPFCSALHCIISFSPQWLLTVILRKAITAC